MHVYDFFKLYLDIDTVLSKLGIINQSRNIVHVQKLSNMPMLYHAQVANSMCCIENFVGDF